MRRLNKKGNALEGLQALGMGIAVLAIVLTVAFLIMSQGKEQIRTIEGLSADPVTGVINSSECAKSLACNSTSSLQSAVDTIPAWVPLIIIAFIGSILLGLVALFKRK